MHTKNNNVANEKRRCVQLAVKRKEERIGNSAHGYIVVSDCIVGLVML